jgi:hypothetical protein
MTVPERVNVETESTEESVKLYCTVHPNVETTLRCNRCGRPMCTRCAVKTPVGYRCRECVRAQQDKFFDAQMLDFLIAFFLAPAAGGVIGTVVWRMTGKRRGRYTAIVVGTGVVAGALPFVLVNPITIGIYLFMATSTAVAQFRLRL